MPEWAKYHPHSHTHFRGCRADNNTLYIATERLQIAGLGSIPGGGTFKHLHQGLILTDPDRGNRKRSVWRLPKWFYSEDQRKLLSCHRKLSPNKPRWLGCESENWTILHSVSPGQEFVLDIDQYPKAIDWISDLMTHDVEETPPSDAS